MFNSESEFYETWCILIYEKKLVISIIEPLLVFQ